MVDINYPNDIICFESLNGSTLSKSDGFFDQHDLESCLDNIDENDLIKFSENVNESTFCYSSLQNFVIDTPPETPVNYNNSNGNDKVSNNKDFFYSSPSSSSSPLSDASLLSDSSTATSSSFTNDFNPSRDLQYSFNNSTNGVLISPSSPSSSIGNVIDNSSILSASPLIINCMNPILNNNSPPMSCSNVSDIFQLNGLQIDSSSLVYSENFDNSSINQINIQPKNILPSKILPNQLTSTKNQFQVSSDKNDFLLKKQKIEARKVRNREAALNSRLKKQEHVQHLEMTVKKLNETNQKLVQENFSLKQRINDLEQELFKLKSLDINGNFESNRKAKISFFAVIFMLFFQVSPYLMTPNSIDSVSSSTSDSKTLLKSSTSNQQNDDSHFQSRTLLWKRSINQFPNDDEYIQLANNLNYNSTNNVFNNMTPLCNEYFNRTESIRLENELRGWLTRFKLHGGDFEDFTRLHMMKLQNHMQQNQLHNSEKQSHNSKKLLYDSKHVPIPRLKLWMQRQRLVDQYMTDHGENDVDLTEPPKRFSSETIPTSWDMKNLMSLVHRRDDTFYYLSYPSKGHLILPPISNRSDIRPRFSFLIPTIYNFSLDGSINVTDNGSNRFETNDNKNNSTINNSPQLFMLQIDCQVVNTKVSLVKLGDNGEIVGTRNQNKKQHLSNKLPRKALSMNLMPKNTNRNKI